MNFEQYEKYKKLKEPFQAGSNSFNNFIIDGWFLYGWIPYIPAIGNDPEKDFARLRYNALSSRGCNERLLVPRSDGSGVNCYFREW